jgi:hypothetical protein
MKQRLTQWPETSTKMESKKRNNISKPLSKYLDATPSSIEEISTTRTHSVDTLLIDLVQLQRSGRKGRSGSLGIDGGHDGR